MDQAASRFFSTVGSDDLGINWIEALWQAELPYMRASRRPNEHCDVCPLMNMGEYCLQVFELLVQFLEGSRLQATIKEHTQARMSHLVDTDDGRAISYLEDKQKALRAITNLLRNAAEQCRDVWSESPVPPQHDAPQHDSTDNMNNETSSTDRKATSSRSVDSTLGPRHQDMATRNKLIGLLPTRKAAQQTRARARNYAHDGFGEKKETGMEIPREIVEKNEEEEINGCGEDIGAANEDDVDDDDEDLDDQGNTGLNDENDDINNDALGRRGTGLWCCPGRWDCKKGGVVNGKLKVFRRNCEIRAHRDRHGLPYECKMSGCKNAKRRFARKDQLERHQKNVGHGTPSAVAEQLQHGGASGRTKS